MSWLRELRFRQGLPNHAYCVVSLVLYVNIFVVGEYTLYVS